MLKARAAASANAARSNPGCPPSPLAHGSVDHAAPEDVAPVTTAATASRSVAGVPGGTAVAASHAANFAANDGAEVSTRRTKSKDASSSAASAAVAPPAGLLAPITAEHATEPVERAPPPGPAIGHRQVPGPGLQADDIVAQLADPLMAAATGPGLRARAHGPIGPKWILDNMVSPG